MRQPSRHNKFFSSLKQVEKRLMSEEVQLSNSSSSSQPLISTNDLASSSMPIYLNNFQTQHHNKNISSSIEDSDPPPQFFSESPHQFLQLQLHPLSQSNALQHNNNNNNDDDDDEGKDEIEELIELLGPFDFKEFESGLKGDGGGNDDDGFYSRIVGVKGPKCEKEVKRLNGWIQYFMRDSGDDDDDNGGVRENNNRERLRVAYLLLGKAAADAAGGIEFPSTVQEFLDHNPPTY